MKTRWLIFIFSLITAFPCAAIAQEVATPTMENVTPERAVKQTAKLFIEALQAHNFEGAVSFFDETMLKAVPASKLAEIWNETETRFGKLTEVSYEPEAVNHDKYKVLLLPLQFANGKNDLRLQLAFSEDGYISGMYFR